MHSRPQPRTRVVLVRLLIGLGALLALFALSVPVANGVMLVRGSSMSPFLHPGQVLVLNRSAYRPAEAGPRRGDVVIFRGAAAGQEDRYLVKRVIGLPGELVLVKAGLVFINGTQLDEPYVVATDDYTYPLQGGPVRVPDGAYFVLGDNRPQSVDSHLGWFVPIEDMVAQAWPLPMAFPSLPAPASA